MDMLDGTYTIFFAFMALIFGVAGWAVIELIIYLFGLIF